MNRNAVIMAAGMSTRFVPLSLEVPKALLKVKGEIIIERQIRQLKEAGVEEIVVVVGYMKDKFQYLQDKYDVILVENPAFQLRNNHSTLYVARKYLKNTFICSGDNYFTENVFKEWCDNSYYASVYVSGKTEEWCLITGENGEIERVQIGGADSWIMKGHAYFNECFSEQLKPYLVQAFEQEESKDKFWEEIYMEHIPEMKMFIHKYEEGIIEEFDSIEELRRFDRKYVDNSGSDIMKKICKELGCYESDIERIQPIKQDGIVVAFSFVLNNKKYIYSVDNHVLCEQKEEKNESR